MRARVFGMRGRTASLASSCSLSLQQTQHSAPAFQYCIGFLFRRQILCRVPVQTTDSLDCSTKPVLAITAGIRCAFCDWQTSSNESRNHGVASKTASAAQGI